MPALRARSTLGCRAAGREGSLSACVRYNSAANKQTNKNRLTFMLALLTRLYIATCHALDKTPNVPTKKRHPITPRRGDRPFSSSPSNAPGGSSVSHPLHPLRRPGLVMIKLIPRLGPHRSTDAVSLAQLFSKRGGLDAQFGPPSGPCVHARTCGCDPGRMVSPDGTLSLSRRQIRP
jgi:hypothetical protein